MVIHLIRHGETEATEQKLYCGSTDLPLSEAGREALSKLCRCGGYPGLEGLSVYTSGMKRAEETLTLLYGEVLHTRLPDLREMDFGAFELQGYETLRENPAYIAWCFGENEKNRCPGGESGEDQKKRVLSALAELLHKGEDCLIVAHGGTIACMMTHFFPEKKQNRYAAQPKPGEGFSITLSQNGEACSRPIPFCPARWEGKGYSFFQNKACEYFPCHKTNRPEDFNCIFCYCPLFALGEDCGGNFRYTKKGDKDCSCCTIPHMRENFGKILEKYPLIRKLASRNQEVE